MPRSRAHPYREPPITYDYRQLIRALTQSREEAVRLTRECGPSLPLRRQAEALVFDIDALSKFLPDPDAKLVRPNRHLPSTP